ncbi:MAG: creatininase family protein [Bacteroidetes bacterium]|nr:MAG: creatininase family protein [Bacteroidota bacterium]
MRPYILAETNWQAVKDTAFEVAVLPWGATEAHNYHLPYATDNIQNEYVVAEAARLVWEAGSRVVVLPNVPFGINTGQLDIPLCMNLNPSTQLAILKDLVDVVQRAGIDKFVILNGHGGNHFKVMIRELSFHFPEVLVCALNWYEAADWNAYFDEPGDHAGEMETSAMQHIAPELVRPLAEAGDGAAKACRLQAVREGWVTIQRPWTQVSADTGVGNPARATAAKGAAYLDACAGRIAAFFQELAQVSRTDLFA